MSVPISTCTRKIFALALLLANALVSSIFADFEKVAVYTSGTEGYNIFRIPTIVKAANGDLLAFAEARTGDDHSEIDIVVKRSVDTGSTWSDLQVVKSHVEFERYFPSDSIPEVTVGNHSPVVDLLDSVHSGRIWVPFTLENNRAFVTYSDDHGASWSAHVEITREVKDATWGWYGFGPVHGIQLQRGPHAGRLVIPSCHAKSGIISAGTHVVFSDDHGKTWELGAIETHTEDSSKALPNENVAVELIDGRIYFNARDNHPSNSSHRRSNFSNNGGQSYSGSSVCKSQIATPVVQNSVIRFRTMDRGDNENTLIYSSPANPDARKDMTIAVSFDESKKTLIHSAPAAYSDLVSIDRNQFGVLFESGEPLHKEILFSRIDYAELNPE